MEGFVKITVQKELNGLKVRLPNDMCRVLGIKERDVLSFAYDKEKCTLSLTGESAPKVRSFPPGYFKKRNEAAPEPDNEPVTTAVPEHIIERVRQAKSKGMKLEQLKAVFNNTTEYSWEDIPEKQRKELETE